MFKIFTVFSLLALIAEGGSAPQSGPWGTVIALVLVSAVIILIALWFRRRYRIVRKMVHDKLRKPDISQSVIKQDAWNKITSGEMARKILGKEEP